MGPPIRPRAVDDAAPAPEQQVRMVMAREDRTLDTAQAEAVRQIGGTGKLVVVEGPAGAGKTTMLVTARDVIREGEGRMITEPDHHHSLLDDRNRPSSTPVCPRAITRDNDTNPG